MVGHFLLLASIQSCKIMVADTSSTSPLFSRRTFLPTPLSMIAHDYSLHLLLRNILAEIVKKMTGIDSHQPIGNNLQWVGDCESGSFLPVVYRDNSHLFLEKKPSITLGVVL